MAKVLVLTDYQNNPPYQYTGDIVGVFNDDHPFTFNEYDRFEIIHINGLREDVKAKLQEVSPKVRTAFLSLGGSEYTFVPPDDRYTTKEVWTSDILDGSQRWYEYNSPFKFSTFVSSLTQIEKDFIATSDFDIDHPSNDSYIRKMIKNFSQESSNNIEVIELRGME